MRLVRAIKVILVVAVTAAAACFTKDSKTPAPGNAPPAQPQKSQSSMTKTPKEECEELMNTILPMAKKLLSEHGEFFPVGGAMQLDGSIAAVATFDGDEHPPSQKVIDSLMEAFRAGAKQKKYKATALVYDIRTVPPGATEKTDAVAIRLDHLGGYSVLVVIPVPPIPHSRSRLRGALRK